MGSTPAEVAEGTGPGSSGDDDEGIGSARKGTGTGVEGTQRAEQGAGGAGTGRGTDPMGYLGYGRRMSRTSRVEVGEGMVIARGETETWGEITGTRL